MTEKGVMMATIKACVVYLRAMLVSKSYLAAENLACGSKLTATA